MTVEPGKPGNRRTGAEMDEKKKRGLTIRLGPLGLSLLAACITAIGVAAVSMAADGGSGNSNSGSASATAPGPPPGGAVMTFHGPPLSAADQKKMDEFQQCMQDNGAPAPPDPSKIDPSQGPPKPPSAADRDKIQKAYEACKDKLPEDMQKAGAPGFGTFKCGPPPGAPPLQGQQQGGNQDQSNNSGTSSSGSSS
jgi:hypothetical protein